METKKLELKVTEGLAVTVLSSSDHEFLMDTFEVAFGYGISSSTIRMHQARQSNELIEGKHFIKGVTISDSDKKTPHNKVFWTKRGIVRLGFFIKSERARLFRDWAEDLIINVNEQRDLFGVSKTHSQKQLPQRRKHNRLSPDRLLDIMVDVAKIEDKQVRLSITNKLMGGQA